MTSNIIPIIIAVIGASGFGELIKFFITRKDDKVDLHGQFDKLNCQFDTINEKFDSQSDRIDRIEESLNKHIEDESEYTMDSIRQRIVRFSDEIYDGRKCTKDHFEGVLIDIDKYERYCESHPEYKNGVAVHSIEYIKEMYSKNLDIHGFAKNYRED